jgi:hypothetical protein
MRTQARHILKASNGVQHGSCSSESTQIQRHPGNGQDLIVRVDADS